MSVVYSNFGGMLVAETRGAEKRQYVSDPQGSLAAELDENQEVTYAATYWPFGEVATETGTKLSDWGYIGLLGYLTDLASLLYVRARHYLTQKARWLTVDPLWPRQSAYLYALSRPISLRDPSGMITFDGCPYEIERFFKELCKRIRELSPNVVYRINQCIEQNLPKGVRCPVITPQRLRHMADWCRAGHIVRCRNDALAWPVGEPAGYAHIDGSISIWWLKTGSNKYAGIFDTRFVRCWGTDKDISFRNLGLTFLHEIGHQVGVEHNNSDDMNQCNDVFATCLYLYIK